MLMISDCLAVVLRSKIRLLYLTVNLNIKTTFKTRLYLLIRHSEQEQIDCTTQWQFANLFKHHEQHTK